MFNDFRRTVSAGLAAAATALVLGASASAQNASTWDAIQESGTLRVGATQAPPWYFKDPATGFLFNDGSNAPTCTPFLPVG